MAVTLAQHPASLLLVDPRTLMAQPFDLGHLQVSGEWRVVAAQIHYQRWQKGSFSVSHNGVLLYQNGSAENQQFGWFDRHGKARPNPLFLHKFLVRARLR